jgi:hypothetical protein
LSGDRRNKFIIDVSIAVATEIVQQARYYRFKQDEKLAKRWESAAIEAIRSLEDFPERAPLLQSAQLEDLRRIQMPRFPFFIYYEVRRASFASCISRMSRETRGASSTRFNNCRKLALSRARSALTLANRASRPLPSAVPACRTPGHGRCR